MATIDQLRLLAVRFDGNGVVTDRWLKTYTCSSSSEGVTGEHYDYASAISAIYLM